MVNAGTHARIHVEQPRLGGKIPMEFVLLRSQRLRATSSRLITLLDERMQSGTVWPPP